MPSWNGSWKKPTPPPTELAPLPASPPLGRPPHHHFGFAQIRLFLRAILQLPASLRSAAALPTLLHEEGLVTAQCGEAPTAQCGRMWLLRIGLFELQRPKVQADDWIWIVDHTIQLGTIKVLLIVGLRLSHWEQQERGPLHHHDLQIILLEPIEKSDGDLVEVQLERAAEVTGVPRAIASDGCRELNKGIRQFRAAHPKTAGLKDLKHKLALLLQGELTNDPRWPEFLQTCAHLRKKMQQTAWAFLAPPATKEKARFMNLGELIRWAAKTRLFLDAPQFPPEANLTPNRLEELVGPLRQFDSALAQWNELIDLMEQSMDEVRQQGYHRGLNKALRRRFSPRSPAAQCFARQLRKFTAEQSRQIPRGEHLPGSSEVLESLIGKGKRLEGQQSKGGFTRMVLGMAAAVVNPTVEYLQQALEKVKTKDVGEWAKTNLGLSLQALRRQTLGCITAEQIQDKLYPAEAANI